MQVAGAVDALDPDELDVAGGGGTRDEGVRPGTTVESLAENAWNSGG